MWRKLPYCFLGFMLSVILLTAAGCDSDAVARNVDSAEDMSQLIEELVSAEYKVYAGLITTALSLVGGIIGIVNERKRTRQMKDAIVSKADQIDRLALSTEAATPNPGDVVTKFMKADTRMRDTQEKKALHTFDSVRKGIL